MWFMVHKSIRQDVWHNDKIAANAYMGQKESIASFSTYTLLVYMVFIPYIKVYIVDCISVLVAFHIVVLNMIFIPTLVDS